MPEKPSFIKVVIKKGASIPNIKPQCKEKISMFSCFACEGQMEFVSSAINMIIIVDKASQYPITGKNCEPKKARHAVTAAPITEMVCGFGNFLRLGIYNNSLLNTGAMMRPPIR